MAESTVYIFNDPDKSKYVKLRYSQAINSKTLKNLLEDWNISSTDVETWIPISSDYNLNDITLIYELLDLIARNPKLDDTGSTEVKSTSQMPDLEKDFFFNIVTKKDTDLQPLFGMLMTANYLDVEIVLQHTARYIASLIKGKTPDQIRATFAISSEKNAINVS